MLKLFTCIAILALLIPSSGCGQPDPSKDPDFNAATLKDPSAIKMDSSVTKKPKQ